MTSEKPEERQQKSQQSTDSNRSDLATAAKNASSEEFEASFQQGTTMLHQGRVAESVPFLEQAHSLQPDHIDAALNLSGAYILTKKFKKAVAVLEPISVQAPDNGTVWINLGAAYLGNPVLAQDAEHEKAIFAFERALEIDPVAPNVAYNLGLIYRDRNETDQAIKWFRQAAIHDPSDKDARSLLKKLEGE